MSLERDTPRTRTSSSGLKDGEPSLIPCCVFLDFSIIFFICGLDPWVGKIPWGRTWQPTPVFLPGESHRQRSLVGCIPWGRKESDTTEHSFSIQ